MPGAWRGIARRSRRAGCAAMAMGVVAWVFAAGLGPTAGQADGAPAPDLSRVRVLVVAPFLDENPLTRPLTAAAAARLALLLRRAPFQVIGPGPAAAAMAEERMALRDLVSPSRAIALATRLGADAVLTGRVIEVDQGRNGRPGRGTVDVEAKARIDFRVLDAGTRLKLFEEEIACAGRPLAADALECVVQALAARLLGPR